MLLISFTFFRQSQLLTYVCCYGFDRTQRRWQRVIKSKDYHLCEIVVSMKRRMTFDSYDLLSCKVFHTLYVSCVRTLHLHIFWYSFTFRFTKKKTWDRKRTFSKNIFAKENGSFVRHRRVVMIDQFIFDKTWHSIRSRIFTMQFSWPVIPSSWCQNVITNISCNWCSHRWFLQISVSFVSHPYWVLNFVSSHFRLGINLLSYFAAKRFNTKRWFSYEITTYE